MRNSYLFIAAAVLMVVGAFAYYAISPLFRVVHLDEAAPVAVQEAESRAKVTGTTGHPASGYVRVVSAEGKQYVRYEEFKTINGPDIFVYLSKDLDAKDFVNLGEVKGTEGNINYEVPEGVDASQYPYVLTWCKQFGVLFNYAKIN